MTDPSVLRSLVAYMGMVLLVGQLALRATGIPFEKFFMAGSFIMVFAATFGTDFVIDLIRVLRSRQDDSGARGD
jgi:hypothetical protein